MIHAINFPSNMRAEFLGRRLFDQIGPAVAEK
jgi:hypothetical protein